MLRFLDGDCERAVTVHSGPNGCRLELPGGAVEARAGRGEYGEIVAEIGGERCAATVVRQGAEVTVLVDGAAYRLRRHDPLHDTAGRTLPGGRLTAPMPGRVVTVMVEPGAEVARGAPLMVVEAMKMEHTIAAPADGRVEHVNYAAGDLVEEGAELLAFAVAGEG